MGALIIKMWNKDPVMTAVIALLTGVIAGSSTVAVTSAVKEIKEGKK